MVFKIYSVSHGWFEVDFDREFLLINTNVTGCDAPLLLLESLCELLENKTTETWLLWQNEPEANVLNLELQGDMLAIRVYDTNDERFSLDYSGITLREHVVNCLYKAKADFIETVKNILNEFSLYENGNGRRRYEAHWGAFPQTQYHCLKSLLRTK